MVLSPGIVAALALAVLVGLSLGLLGGGGAILTVPILTYVAGISVQQAIPASLVIVGTTSLVSTITHARARRVRWRTGAVVGSTGVLGALGGSLLGKQIPDPVLMVLFAAMMIAAAVAMLRRRRADAAPADRQRPSIPRLLLIGLGVGTATGLVGAGGGFLLVPALILFAGLPAAVAVGTSLAVVVLNSAIGLTGHLLSTPLDWPLVLTFTGIAIAGSFLGAAFAGRLPERTLQRTFGVFILLIAAVVLTQEVPAVLGAVGGP